MGKKPKIFLLLRTGTCSRDLFELRIRAEKTEVFFSLPILAWHLLNLY
jgi:hypothetical protein